MASFRFDNCTARVVMMVAQDLKKKVKFMILFIRHFENVRTFLMQMLMMITSRARRGANKFGGKGPRL
jgi:hypothetical protein